MLFTGEQRSSFKETHPSASIGELSKLMGAKWKAMGDSEKEPYTSKADALKLEYEAAKKRLDDATAAN